MFSKDEGKIKGKSENQKIKTTIDCLMDDEVKLKNHTIEGSNDNSLFISNRKNNIVNNSTISYNASNLNISNLDINNLDSKNYDNSFDNDFELKETHLKKSIINNKNINSNDSEIFSNEFYKPNKNKLSFFQESEEDNIVKIGNQMGLFDNSISNQGIPKRKQNNKPTRTSYSRYNKS